MSEIHRIAVNIDELDELPQCFEQALEFARQEAAELQLISVLPPFDDVFSFFADIALRAKLQEELESQSSNSLDTFAASVEQQGISCATVLRNGSKASELIAGLLEIKANLLIKDASFDSADERGSLGALDRKLVRQCPCPLWIVRKSDPQNSQHQIAVAVNADTDDALEIELNRRLLSYGALLAKLKSLPLHIVYAWSFDSGRILQGRVDDSHYLRFRNDAEESAGQLLSKCIEQAGFRVRAVCKHPLPGSPSEVISKYCRANHVDTLVIGTVGRSGLSGILIGNTAERVLSQIESSLLVVRPEELFTPLGRNLLEEADEQDIVLRV